MTAATPGDITRQLRDMYQIIRDHSDVLDYGDGKRENRFLDIINAVEYLEGNFLSLASITAATADDIAETKTMSRYKLDRHHSIMTTLLKMLAGIPSWRYPSKAEDVVRRTEHAHAILDRRLNKVPR